MVDCVDGSDEEECGELDFWGKILFLKYFVIFFWDFLEIVVFLKEFCNNYHFFIFIYDLF